MNGETRNTHLPERIIDQHVEGELSRAETMTAEAHLSVCSRCRDRVSEYRAFLTQLNELPHPAVPSGFSVRILDAVLPRPSESALILRWMTRAYVGIVVALAAVAATVLGVSGGPGPVAGSVAAGFSRTMWEGIAAARSLVLGAIDVMKTAIDLLPVAEVGGSLARGLETTAVTIASQYSLIIAVLCVLATLVLLWATSPARERGVPHVSLSL